LSNDRTLWGYSLGGIFALYTLFQKPNLFQRYIIVDGFDEKYFELEKIYASQHTDLPIRLFISASPVTFGNELSKFFVALENRNYPTFHAEYAPLNEIGHFAVVAEGLTKGLVSVFGK
jgi:pimeloyl-ACP methyl ester carboxylesterase